MTTDVCWRPPDNFLVPAEPPFRNNEATRSREGLIAAVEQFRVEESFRYQKRDVTGDGVDETFCNVFAIDVSRAMGCPLPFMRANELADWIEVKGPKKSFVPVPAEKALQLVEAGCFVTAVRRNPDPKRSGHIVVLRPHGVVGSRVVELRCAQAGLRNFNDGPLKSAFPDRAVRLFAHP